MEKKHRYLITIITVLTFVHMAFCTFYPTLSAYFNTHDHLRSFLTAVQLIRAVFLTGIAFSGFIAIKDRAKKIVPFYLVLFLFNLVIPFIFR